VANLRFLIGIVKSTEPNWK